MTNVWSSHTIALTRRTFVGKVMSLLFNMLSRLVIAFLPKSKCLLISWHMSPTAVILEPLKIKSLTVSIVSPSICHEVMGFPCSPVGKESACSSGDLGSIPGLGRSPGEGNGNPLQYPCLENLIGRGAWWAVVHRVAKSWAQLSD